MPWARLSHNSTATASNVLMGEQGLDRLDAGARDVRGAQDDIFHAVPR